MDFAKINAAAEGYKDDMVRFLRAIVRNPGESCGEKEHIETIAAEMKKLNFDEVTIDPQGNVIGYMGTGDRLIRLVSETSTTGLLIHTKDMKLTKKLADVVFLTSAAVLFLLYMAHVS